MIRQITKRLCWRKAFRKNWFFTFILLFFDNSCGFGQTVVPTPISSPGTSNYYHEKAVKPNPELSNWSGPWTSYYDDGKIKEKGTYDHGRRVGVWNYWYPNGNKLGELTCNIKPGISHLILWHQNGNKFLEGDCKPHIYVGDGDTLLKFLVWDSTGHLVVKGDCVSDTISFTSLWPNGKDGLSCSITPNVCGEKEISVFSESTDPYFTCSIEEEGWGNSDRCVQHLSVNQRPYIQAQKSGFNGSVTLFYPSWIKEFSFDVIPDVAGKLIPCLIQEYKNGRRNGSMVVYEPFNDGNKMFSGNFIDDFADGLFDVGFDDLYATSKFQNGNVITNWQGPGLLPYKIEKDTFDFVFDPPDE